MDIRKISFENQAVIEKIIRTFLKNGIPAEFATAGLRAFISTVGCNPVLSDEEYHSFCAGWSGSDDTGTWPVWYYYGKELRKELTT